MAGVLVTLEAEQRNETVLGKGRHSLKAFLRRRSVEHPLEAVTGIAPCSSGEVRESFSVVPWVTKSGKMLVTDISTAEELLEGALGEAALPGDRVEANIDHGPHPAEPEPRDNPFRIETFIANTDHVRPHTCQSRTPSAGMPKRSVAERVDRVPSPDAE